MKPVRVSMPMDANDLPNVVTATTKLKENQYWPKSDRPKWIFMLFSACALLDITRVCMSLCVVEVAKELEWDKLETGLILSSIFWGYFTTQLPAGFLSDTHGGDIIVLWSLFGCAVSTLAVPFVTTETAVLYFAPSILLVLFSRVCLGFSQGLYFPSMFSLIAKKLPLSDRSMGNAVISSGGAVGALITGSVGSIILATYGWRWVFLSFGLVNILWVLVWKQFFVLRRTTNEDIYKLTKKFESQEHKHQLMMLRNSTSIIPWGKLIRQPAIWAIVVAHFCNNCMTMNLSSWLPTYFHETFPQAKGWIFNVVPYICVFVGKIAGGQFADKLIQLGCSVTFVRKLCETIATALPGVLLLLCMYATEFWQALTCVSLAFGLSGFESSGSICNIQDLSPTFAGSISGMVFTITSIPGILGVYLTGYILHATGSWNVVFQLTAIICFTGNLFYVIFGTSRRIA